MIYMLIFIMNIYNSYQNIHAFETKHYSTPNKRYFPTVYNLLTIKAL